MGSSHNVVLFAAFSALVGVMLLAQPQPASSQPTIRTNVPLVLVPATVTDKKGNFIDGLSADDFLVSDDGVRQKVRLDTSDTVLAPVSLVVAVQSSGISATELDRIHRVGGLIQPLVIGDRGQAAVVAFDSEVRVFQEFTSDSAKIRSAFEQIEPRTIKQARMLDAVATGVRMLETRPEGRRRVMLVLGESRDRGSAMKLAQAIEVAQRAGVIVYLGTYSAHAAPWTAKPENAPPMPGGPDYLGAITELARLGKTNAAEAFARATGGRHLSLLTMKSLEDSIARTGEEIHSQYLLSFVPGESRNTGFHRIEVIVLSRPDAVVRARPGYWAVPQ
jgi:VWFA-related protein